MQRRRRSPSSPSRPSRVHLPPRQAAERLAIPTTSGEAARSRVAVGVIRRPWGFDGSIAVAQYSDDTSRFRPQGQVFIDGAAFSIERVQLSGKSTVLKLASVNTEDQASALRGRTIEVEVSALPSPPEGVYYHYQIIGTRVVTVGGEDLGTVSEILETGSNDVYLVRAEPHAGQDSAPDILIPALKGVIVSVDIERGVIVVDLPEGLR